MTIDGVIKKRGKTIPTKTPLSVEIRKGIYMLIFALLSIIVLASIVYLLNSSQTSQKGYSLKADQLEKDSLIKVNHDLVSKIIQAQSFKTIENQDNVKSMIKPENPIYIDSNKDSGNQKK